MANDKDENVLGISPQHVTAYAVYMALQEGVASGMISQEAADFVQTRGDEIILLLLAGVVLTKQDDGTYKPTPREADNGPLVIGD